MVRCLRAAGRGLGVAGATLSTWPPKYPPNFTALAQALTLRQPAPGLVVHADRGSQYTSQACRQRIEQAGALPSYARPGNPSDNAQAEAGWSTLKTESLPHGEAFANCPFRLDHPS